MRSAICVGIGFLLVASAAMAAERPRLVIPLKTAQSNTCQTVCQNGRAIQVTCNGQQNCCADTIQCRVWCTSRDASTC